MRCMFLSQLNYSRNQKYRKFVYVRVELYLIFLPRWCSASPCRAASPMSHGLVSQPPAWTAAFKHGLHWTSLSESWMWLYCHFECPHLLLVTDEPEFLSPRCVARLYCSTAQGRFLIYGPFYVVFVSLTTRKGKMWVFWWSLRLCLELLQPYLFTTVYLLVNQLIVSYLMKCYLSACGQHVSMIYPNSDSTPPYCVSQISLSSSCSSSLWTIPQLLDWSFTCSSGWETGNYRKHPAVPLSFLLLERKNKPACRLLQKNYM